MLAIKILYSIILGIFVHLNLFEIRAVLSTDISLSEKYGVFIALILVVLIGPMIEEVAFRGWISDSEVVIKYSLPFLFLYTLLFMQSIFFTNLGYIKYILGILGTIPIVYLCWLTSRPISLFIRTNKITLVRLSIFSFSVIHLFNYSLDRMNLVASLILVLPYPFASWVLTQARMKIGLFGSIALHVAANSLIIFPTLWGNYRP